jgi:hypothetical protein
MTTLLSALIGGLTLGLPLWFAFLDRQAFPRLRWMDEGEPTPTWGHWVVVVGVFLAVLVALAAPLSEFQPPH